VDRAVGSEECGVGVGVLRMSIEVKFATRDENLAVLQNSRRNQRTVGNCHLRLTYFHDSTSVAPIDRYRCANRGEVVVECSAISKGQGLFRPESRGGNSARRVDQE